MLMTECRGLLQGFAPLQRLLTKSQPVWGCKINFARDSEASTQAGMVSSWERYNQFPRPLQKNLCEEIPIQHRTLMCCRICNWRCVKFPKGVPLIRKTVLMETQSVGKFARLIVRRIFSYYDLEFLFEQDSIWARFIQPNVSLIGDYSVHMHLSYLRYSTCCKAQGRLQKRVIYNLHTIRTYTAPSRSSEHANGGACGIFMLVYVAITLQSFISGLHTIHITFNRTVIPVD